MNNYHEFPANLIQIILQHHESCNGKGFPFKLSKAQICPGAKIIFIVDLFCHYIKNNDLNNNLTPKEALVAIEKNHLTEIDPKRLFALKKLIS
jgi:HD-GYP domain-containing protein (c-di-GMP phosphodiesterase class II)